MVILEPDATVEIVHVADVGDNKIYEVVKKYGCFNEQEARDLQKYLIGKEDK